MKVDLENLNPGAWFDLPGGGRVCVRKAPPAVTKSIEKKTTKRKVEYKRGARYEVFNTDEDMADRMLWDYLIVDWEGINTPAGDPIECTTENKVALMGGSVDFGNAVAEALETLGQEEREREEAQEKNSQTSCGD